MPEQLPVPAGRGKPAKRLKRAFEFAVLWLSFDATVSFCWWKTCLAPDFRNFNHLLFSLLRFFCSFESACFADVGLSRFLAAASLGLSRFFAVASIDLRFKMAALSQLLFSLLRVSRFFAAASFSLSRFFAALSFALRFKKAALNQLLFPLLPLFRFCGSVESTYVADAGRLRIVFCSCACEGRPGPRFCGTVAPDAGAETPCPAMQPDAPLPVGLLKTVTGHLWACDERGALL